MLPSLARFNQSRQSRSSWFIAIRSTFQPYGCQEELSTWLKEELFTWPRHGRRGGQNSLVKNDKMALAAGSTHGVDPK
jgi:hypothetical protein